MWELANLKKLLALFHVPAQSPFLLHEVRGATSEQKGSYAKQCWMAGIRYLHTPVIYEWHMVHIQLHSKGPLWSKPAKLLPGPLLPFTFIQIVLLIKSLHFFN